MEDRSLQIVEEFNFEKYQEMALRTIKPHDTFELAVSDWVFGLAGETGEVAELLKHAMFHKDREVSKMELAKELGDILWYMTALANEYGINLEEVAMLNAAKLEHRYHGGVYTVSSSGARHAREEKFTDTSIYKHIKASVEKEDQF